MSASLIARGSLFDDFFRGAAPGFYVKPLHGDSLPAQIRVDVKETPEAYQLVAEIPGVSKDDIQIDIEGKRVSLRAEIKPGDAAADGTRLLRSERYYGVAQRSFQLPVEVDNTSARARYENGVLALNLPKKASATSQRVAVE